MDELLTILIVIALTNEIITKSVTLKAETVNSYSHLQFEGITRICDNRNLICEADTTNVCTMRKVHGKVEYKDFENSCFASIANMCEYPGSEFHIVTSGSCDVYFVARRNGDANEISASTVGYDSISASAENSNANDSSQNSTEYSSYEDSYENSTKPGLRADPSTSQTKYDIETAYDDHPCPYFCTDAYDPYCVTVNRGRGMYFKYYTFLNHCKGDMYYCGHWREFQPPPDESSEAISDSKLDWSFCASFRYMQFARFSEQASSMGHYGWLVGDQRYSQILGHGEKERLTGNQRYKSIFA